MKIVDEFGMESIPAVLSFYPFVHRWSSHLFKKRVNWDFKNGVAQKNGRKRTTSFNAQKICVTA